MDVSRDVLCLMATSSGKSMVIAVAAEMERMGMVTVVYLPLLSLLDDWRRRLRAIKVAFQEYVDPKSTPSLSVEGGIVLVSYDKAKTSGWQKAIGELNSQMPVGRLVFDEGHYGLTADDFRPALRHLYEHRQTLACQVVVLTGTCPPSSQTAMVKLFGLHDPTVIRMSTDRPELRYVRERVPEEPAARTVEVVEAHLPRLQAEDRVLVFVAFFDDGKRIAHRLRCEFYHGGGPNKEKDALSVKERSDMAKRWMRGGSGRSQVMVCTSAFGAGNDYPHVRLSVHCGTPRDMLGFIQEMSRCGRDHRPATCVLVPSKVSYDRPNVRDDHKGAGAAFDYAMQVGGPNRCLRSMLTLHCDGLEHQLECRIYEGDVQQCGSCVPGGSTEAQNVVNPD